MSDTSPDPDVTTAAGVLTVYENLAITAVYGISPDTIPPNMPMNPIEVNLAEEVTFTVETSGGIPTLTYLWEFDDGVTGWQTLSDGAHVSGSGSTVADATTASVTIDPIMAQADAGDTAVVTVWMER